jgi:4'-phosphopantetheinyl transferase
MWWLAQGEHQVPEGVAWLSPRERSALAGIRFRKRHVEFLTRRWTAKRALATVLRRELSTAALAGVEIVHQPGGAPCVRVDGRTADIDVSLSDRAGWAVCLIGPPGGDSGPLGIDLEIVEPRSDAFVEDFFTASERAHVQRLPVRQARDEAANLIWSAKEAALKVLKVGLRADTRDVAVDLAGDRRPDGWAPFKATGRDGASFPGWWRRDGVFLLTIAGTTPCEPPGRLEGAAPLETAAPVHSWIERPLV